VQEFCNWQQLAQFFCKFFLAQEKKLAEELCKKNWHRQNSCTILLHVFFLCKSCGFLLFYFIANGLTALLIAQVSRPHVNVGTRVSY